MIKRIIILLCCTIGIAFSIWLLKKPPEEKPLQEAAASQEAAKEAEGLEQKVLSFTIDGRSPKGAKQWHLEGNSAEIRGDDIYLNDLKAVVYGDNVTANLTSDAGLYRRNKGEVELMGNVKVFGDDGFTLTTEKARWSQATKEIFTDDIVNIKREGMTAVGTGGMANSDAKIALLKENITVMIEPDTKVNCTGPLEVDYSSNVAVFHDNVVVVDKDGKMYSDKLTVNLDAETQNLKQVTAEGNVKIKRGKSYTLSEKAIYTDSTKSAQLLGKPRVIIDPDDLAGMENLTKSKE